jgi:hypothetical protein
VTDPAAVEISTAHGPLHAGTGAQNIYYYPSSLADPKGRTPQRQVADDLNELARRFVQPRGLGDAREVLRLHQTVFLQAPPGGGRPTAAKLLLKELATPEETIFQLWLQEKATNARAPFDFTHVGDGDHAWADLTDTGGWSWDEIHGELLELRSTARHRNAHLVVILPDEAVLLNTEIDQFRVRLEAPSLDQVLRSHLRAAGFGPLEVRQSDALEFVRSDRPLRDVPEYVRLVAEAQNLAAGEADFKTWCDTAFKAFEGRKSEASAFIRTLKGGSDRALLFSVAMLHGAHGDAVDHAATALMARAEHAPDLGSLLEHEMLDRRLDSINAKADVHGNVRFKILGFDAAVRSYFWTQLPGLRQPIVKWLPVALDSPDLSQAERDNLVTNFADLCLTDRYHAVLLNLVAQFTSQHTTAARVNAAALILRRGLRAERCAREFRRQIYDWSINRRTSDQLAAVLVAACRDEIFATHPDEAMVRLHHLARRNARSEAHKTLAGLARADPRSMRQMLARIADPPPDTRPWEADPWLFLDIAHPWTLAELGDRRRALITEGAVAERLSRGWALVFEELPHESWARYAESWLSCAAAIGEHRNTLLNTLVRGAAREADTLASLYAIAVSADFRDSVSDLLLRKITQAQGVALP